MIHPMALLGVHELIHADGIAGGHAGPIVGLAIDARDLIAGNWKILNVTSLRSSASGADENTPARRQQNASRSTAEALIV